MARKKRLSKKQLAMIEEMFGGELDEQAVLDKHKVSRNVYNKWLANGAFADEFDRRIASARRQGELIIAKYASLAAAKLVQLTESKSQETARKACLDIISLPQAAARKAQGPSETERASEQESQQLSDETASKLLAVLAEEKREKS
jgi:hypothetical protein